MKKLIALFLFSSLVFSADESNTDKIYLNCKFERSVVHGDRNWKMERDPDQSLVLTPMNPDVMRGAFVQMYGIPSVALETDINKLTWTLLDKKFDTTTYHHTFDKITGNLVVRNHVVLSDKAEPKYQIDKQDDGTYIATSIYYKCSKVKPLLID
jgi:hypothetical protein